MWVQYHSRTMFKLFLDFPSFYTHLLLFKYYLVILCRPVCLNLGYSQTFPTMYQIFLLLYSRRKKLLFFSTVLLTEHFWLPNMWQFFNTSLMFYNLNKFWNYLPVDSINPIGSGLNSIRLLPHWILFQV